MTSISLTANSFSFPFPCLRDAAGYGILTNPNESAPMLYLPFESEAFLWKLAPDTPLWIYVVPDASEETLLSILSTVDALLHAGTLGSCIVQPKLFRLLSLSFPDRISSVTTMRSMYCPSPRPFRSDASILPAAAVPYGSILRLMQVFLPKETDEAQRVSAATRFTECERAFALKADDTIVSLGKIAWSNESFSLINDIVTTPEARNRGYMKTLLSHLLTLVWNGSLPILYVDETNEAAKHVYRSVGFWDGILLKTVLFS